MRAQPPSGLGSGEALFPALHASHAASLTTPTPPACAPAPLGEARWRRDGDGPLSRQSRVKRSRRAHGVSPRQGVLAETDTPPHTHTHTNSPPVGTAAPRLLLEPAGLQLGLCGQEKGQGKVQAARAALPQKVRGEGLYATATGVGTGCGEVPRVSGHRLQLSEDGTTTRSQVRTGDPSLRRRSTWVTSSGEDASTSWTAVLKKCRHLQTRDFICACF